MKDRQFGRVRFIRGENKGRYPFSHSVYIEGDKEHIIIDPACSLDKLGLLKQNEGVDAVWLSHWHEDHFTYLYLFDNLTLRLAKRDFPPLTDIDSLLDWYGIESGNHRDYWRKAILEKFHYQPRKKANFITDGAIIDCGSVTVEVIATPGHTPGHLYFFFC
jgi:hydroxyacylglutathione hydrolase